MNMKKITLINSILGWGSKVKALFETDIREPTKIEVNGLII
jgi:hypothetical protein